MNQLQEYKTFVRERCGRVRLGEILRSCYSAEYRKHHSHLRQEGWTVGVKLNKSSPGENLYSFAEPDGKQRLICV